MIKEDIQMLQKDRKEYIKLILTVVFDLPYHDNKEKSEEDIQKSLKCNDNVNLFHNIFCGELGTP